MLTSTVSPLLKLGLCLIGMWPDFSCRTFFWFFYMATLVIMQYFQYSYFFAQLGTNDFSKLMDGLSITLDYTLTFLKLLSLWHNRRIFSDILGAMNDDWNNCSTHTCMMMNKANLAHRCSNVMLILNSLSVIFYFVGNYMNHRIVSTDFREFPIQIQFPFHATDSPIFEFIVLGLFLHVWETAIVIALLNSLILTFSSYFEVLHVSGQIDIMCQGLREISTTQKSHPSAMRSLIEMHQRIISLSKNIDNFFSFVALIQFVWNTIVICSIGIMIMISLSTDVEGKSGLLIQSIVPYIAVTLEAFVFCFAGEYLSTKSKSISDAAYETLWYDLSISECRILLLIIVRSQKRLTITAGKIMDLTLEGFTSVMKASASYMSVLHVMY
ncbi:PREDICTED: odorant receptor 4-like [Atta colombica]|uniref:odorant receptor 4-like n=1 Tax=Atta colombica TaxID=520822 RepID=UPI00084C8A2E|nr:PREDICTED: odorant receptor 4-like [Atta colombica]